MTPSDLPVRQSQLLKCAEPLLNDMPASSLKHALFEAFWSQERSLLAIEDAFVLLVAHPVPMDELLGFFAGWWHTHDDRRSTRSLASHLASLVETVPLSSARSGLARTVHRLQRLNADGLDGAGQAGSPGLFNAMASAVCGSERWAVREPSAPAALVFGQWFDACCQDRHDPLPGLLATLVRHVYVWIEAHYLQPLFRRWLAPERGWPVQATHATQAWFQLHAGPAQVGRFLEALAALEDFTRAMAVAPGQPAARAVFAQYLYRRSRAMLDCARTLPVPATNPSGQHHERSAP